MFNTTRRSYTTPLLAGAAAAALLIAWAPGAGAQVSTESLPQQQASAPAIMTAPPLPLGRDDVREMQNQLIALGFDPGPADGQIGPATTAAAQQYDQNRGASGRVAIDSEFLARLKADTGPRLTYDQVAARQQARQQAQTPAQAYSTAPASNQFGNVVQQLVPLIGAMISNSNNSSHGAGYYGPGYGPGPGDFAPGPAYYGPGPGYWHGY